MEVGRGAVAGLHARRRRREGEGAAVQGQGQGAGRAQIAVRAEEEGDQALIADVVRRAYADVAYSDHREHMMIERLRGTRAYLPCLSLIAEVEGPRSLTSY